MKRIFTTSLILIMIVILGTSGIKSVQNSSSPPTGYTGATGTYCNNCHSGNTLNATGGGITATGLPGGYTLNTVYSFSITINHAAANRKRWGFAIKAVNANGVAVGTFTSSNANANVSSGELRHLNAPILATAVSSYTYANLKWAAPATNNLADKNIRFFIVAVAADGTGGNNADFVYSKLLTISPATVIKSFTPVKGNTGTSVFIKGGSFTGATDVSFGGVAAQSFTVNTDTTITAIVGTGASGNVSVTSPAGTASLAGFTYCAVTPTTSNTSLFGCKSLVYNDSTYYSSAIVKDTIRTQNGCDSVYRSVNINVKSINPVSQTINPSTCDKYVYNNITYTSSTVIKDTLRTNEGCDSVYLTINATVNPSVTGRIYHLTKGDIQNVKVLQTGTVANTYAANGKYDATCLPANSTIVLKASKNNDITKSNGVTSVDALLVQRHILNTTKLNSAYKIIAADVTGDKQINSTDILRIKRLILGADTTFSSTSKGNRLWEFVDSAYVFPDTTNPFPFKDSISFANLTSSKNNQTFIGVKLGDVNYDWNPAVAKGIAANSLQLIANSRKLANNNLQLVLTSANFNNIAALQTTLHFDNTKYEFVGIQHGKLQLDYNVSKANTTGNIALLWTDKNAEAKSFDKDEVLFTVILKPRSVGVGNLELVVNNDMVETEVWDNNFAKRNIVLTQTLTNDKQQAPHDLLVYPNPAKDIIKVNILNYNNNHNIVLELTNAEGQLILKNTGVLQQGNNVITINLKDKKELKSGVYFLKSTSKYINSVTKVYVE